MFRSLFVNKYAGYPTAFFPDFHFADTLGGFKPRIYNENRKSGIHTFVYFHQISVMVGRFL